MASTTQFAAFLHRRTNRITRVLIYALLEWTLISLLLLNSLFSVFIYKFAKYFGLKPPCIFCSRLDHHFRQPQKGQSSSSSISLDIICEQHAAEISRIGYCSNHRKLVESQSMCVDCSSSSAHDATFFSWMRKIGIVKSDGVVVNDDDDAKKCTCCDGIIEFSSLDRSTGDLVINQRGQLDSEVDPKFGYEILGHIDDDDYHEEEEEEEKGEKEGVVGLKPEKEPLINNDKDEHEEEEEKDGTTESNISNKEVVSDRSINLCPDMLPQHLEFYIDHDDYRLIPVDLVDSVKVKKDDISGDEEDDCKEFDLVFEGNELLNGCMFKESLPSIQEEEDEDKMGISLPHEEEEGKIEEEEKMEISQPQEEEENNVEESISSVSQESNNEEKCFPHLEEQEEKFEVVESHYDESKNDDEKACPILQEDEEKIEISQPHEEEHKEEEQKEEIISMEISKTHEEDLKSDESTSPTLKEQMEEIMEISQPHIEEECKHEESNLASLQEEEKKLEEDSVISHHFQEESLETDQKAHILEVKEEDTVTVPTEIITSASLDDEHTAGGEPEAGNDRDFVLKINERSLNIDVGSSQNELESEEKVPDTPSSVESLHNLHKKLLLLGRRESATEESLDGSMISEHEVSDGGATIDKLKSELHAERKTLRALYKELEEERSAAAIAANQTMAMINRLQEEKATMQMEALQYQRMLEEQSEYDQEALQMMNELMVKREKEKQELERELEVLRKKVMDYEERERVRVLCRRRSRNSSASCSYGEESDGLSIDLNHEVKEEDHEEDHNGVTASPLGRGENGHQDTPTEAVLGLQESLAGFEDERQAILEQLKALEEKLFTLADEEEEHVHNMKPFDQFYEENGGDFDVNGDHDNNGFSHHHVNGKLNGSMQKRLLPLFDATELMESPDVELEGREQGFGYVDQLNKSPITKYELEKKRLAIEDEVDVLYERLQALEADREFLKHCIGSLRKGDKGLDLLQEILQHLRDLKNVELQAMKNMDQCASV